MHSIPRVILCGSIMFQGFEMVCGLDTSSSACAVERAGGADGRNELVTFQRLFLCLSSPSSSLLSSAAVSLQHWKPSIHPSKTVSGVVAHDRLLSACAQVLPIGVGGTFDRPRKTLIKRPLNGGRDHLSSFPEAFGAGADVASSKSVRANVRGERCAIIVDAE